MDTTPHMTTGRRPRTRHQPNPLRDWLESPGCPLTKSQFAALVGVSPAYVSQLIADIAPWPGRAIARQIALITEGDVTPNDLAGYPPRD